MTETQTNQADEFPASDLDYIERLALAAPATTLGKLQRGRGAGWLECLELTRDEANDLLWRCIVFDPRWDQQIERREDCCTSVALLRDFDVNRLYPEQLSPVEWRDRRPVAVVLSHLDRARVEDTGTALLEEIGPEGSSRDVVMPEILRATPHTTSRLPEVLVHRRPPENPPKTIDRTPEFPRGELENDRSSDRCRLGPMNEPGRMKPGRTG